MDMNALQSSYIRFPICITLNVNSAILIRTAICRHLVRNVS